MRYLQVQRLDLLGGEEEPVPEDAIPAQGPARIVLQRHGDIDSVLEVLLYALDERDLPLESNVHNVPSGARPEQDPAPLLDLDTLHSHALERGPPLLIPEEVLHLNPSPS